MPLSESHDSFWTFSEPSKASLYKMSSSGIPDSSLNGGNKRRRLPIRSREDLHDAYHTGTEDEVAWSDSGSEQAEDPAEPESVLSNPGSIIDDDEARSKLDLPSDGLEDSTRDDDEQEDDDEMQLDEEPISGLTRAMEGADKTSSPNIPIDPEVAGGEFLPATPQSQGPSTSEEPPQPAAVQDPRTMDELAEQVQGVVFGPMTEEEARKKKADLKREQLGRMRYPGKAAQHPNRLQAEASVPVVPVTTDHLDRDEYAWRFAPRTQSLRAIWSMSADFNNCIGTLSAKAATQVKNDMLVNLCVDSGKNTSIPSIALDIDWADEGLTQAEVDARAKRTVRARAIMVCVSSGNQVLNPWLSNLWWSNHRPKDL